MALPFVGPSYQLSNRKASSQRSVNLFLVGMETPSKAPFIMQAVPGLALFASLGAEVRGMYEAAGRTFVAAGGSLYEVFANGTSVSRGALLTTTGPVEMAWGTTELVLVDGANGYVLNLGTNAFSRITSEGWLGSKRVSYLDGYFIFVDPGTQKFYCSAIDDASSLDALDFASAESSPDNINAHLVDHREIWLLGDLTTEVWFNAGGSDFPFARNQGAILEVGCIATFSAQKIDNGLMWLGRDKNGSGIVYRSNGYQASRISTIAVEEALQASSDLSQAVAYVYQQDGMTFYAVNAPGVASTWVYEVSTGAWHERCDLDANGEFEQWRVTSHVYSLGLHLMGDASGKLYRLDKTKNTFNGDRRKCRRVSPHSSVPLLDWLKYQEFVLDLQVGLNAQGSNPVAELSWSNDGGMTYGNPVQRSIGAVGQYFARVVWQRLGMARDRVWRLDFSDDAPFSIINGVAR